MASQWRIDTWLDPEDGGEGHALWCDDVVCLLHETDFAPLATAALAALRTHDPAAHRALMAEQARAAGLRVLTAEQADGVRSAPFMATAG